jgi:hypothetical protein
VWQPFKDIFRLYVRIKTDGWFSYPCELSKMSFLSHKQGEVLGTTGLSIVNNTDNDFLYDVNSSPYLTLGKNTGFSQAGSQFFVTFDALVGSVGDVGAVQVFFKVGKDRPATRDQDFVVFEGIKVRLNRNRYLVPPSTGVSKILIDGKVCYDKENGINEIPQLEYNHWHCIAFVFQNDVPTNDQSKITCTLQASNFENVGYFLTKGSVDKNFEMMKSVWRTYTLSEPLLIQGSQPLELTQSDVAAYPGVSWQQIDIEPL